MTERHTYTVGYLDRLSTDKRMITKLTVLPDARLVVLARTGVNAADLIGACDIRIDGDRILADVELLPDAKKPIGWPVLTLDTTRSGMRPRWPVEKDENGVEREVMIGDPIRVEIEAVAQGCMFTTEPAWPDLISEPVVPIAAEAE